MSKLIFLTFLLMFFAVLLGYLLGFTLRRLLTNNQSPLDSSEMTSDMTQRQETSTATTAPAAAAPAANESHDDLKRIYGIGKKYEKTLNDLGIVSLSQVAALNDEDIVKLNKLFKFGDRIHREEWVEQARSLMRGEETYFSKRVDRGEVPTSKD